MRTNHLFPRRRPRSWPAFFTQAAKRPGLCSLLAGLGLALALVLHAAPAAHAFPPILEANINGTNCFLVDAITAANTDTATGDCAAGNPGMDTIDLLDNVTLTAVNNNDTGLPQITSEITINGNGFTITRDSGAPDFRIMWVDGSGNLTLNDTTVSGGYFAATSGPVGGGIISFGTLTLNNSTVSNNKAASNGGGIASFSTLTVNNSTISGNSGGTNSFGGGIGNFGTTIITNSTISGNSNTVGGGIGNNGALTIINSTIVGNSAPNEGSGLYTSAGAISTLEDTLVAGNSAPVGSEIANGPESCSFGCIPAGVTNADSFNLFGHSGKSNAQAFSDFTPGASDITATSDGTTPTALTAILDMTLQNNGGGTETHALVTGSPAVDAAPTGLATDQRGVSRPQGANFDIGSFELEQASNGVPVIAADNASVTVDEGQTAANTGTVSDPDGDPVSLTASVGTVVNNNDGTWSWSFTTSSTADSQTVTITADDGNGGTAQTTFDLTVNAVAIVNARINGTDCNLIDAITAANTDTATGACAAGTPGADTIELLDNVTLYSASGFSGLPQITSEITLEGAGFTIARDAGSPNFVVIALSSSGNLTLNTTTVTGGRSTGGGGFFNRGTLTLNNSTVSGNSVDATTGTPRGGGIINLGTVVLNNSTISSNTAQEGGAVYNSGTLTLNNSAVSGNTSELSAAIHIDSGMVTVNNSIIANQTAGADCFGPITSAGYNLDSDGTCSLSAIGDISNGSANLGPLQVNAPGSTATHALLAGSQAIDAAPSGPPTDQRGVIRPQGCAFDIGAYELEQSPCVVNEPPVANAGPDQSVFRNDVVTVSGTWTDPNEAANNPYSWSWDLDGDAIPDDSGSANYGDTIVRTTSFAVEGVATLTFTVTDSAGATSSDTVDITVVNRAPVTDDQSVTTDEDTAVPVTLTASDADGDTLTYSVLTLPSNGTLSGTAPNLTYTPNANFFGSDSFTFQVNDGLVDSNIATVSITVNSVNDPVVAVNDSAMTDEDVPVTVDVQGNDSAGPANEDPALSTTAVTDPATGTAVINGDGSVTYTPDLDYNGTDSFDYTVCDSEGACATATVTVLVEMVNDPPTANDDSVTTDEDTPVTFDVLTNDSDVDGNLDPASVSALSAPANGALADNGNGSFTYTPNANFNGNDGFAYEVCDSDGVCDSATVMITVNPVNDAPVCTDVTPSVTTLWPPNHQFVPVTVSGATDLEGDAITISVSSIFQDEPTNGTGDGDTSPDGQGLGSSTAEVRSERQGSGNGRYYHITISASDGNGGSCSATVQVSVPKNQGKKGAAVDDGPLYDSTVDTSAASISVDSPTNGANQGNAIFLPLVNR